LIRALPFSLPEINTTPCFNSIQAKQLIILKKGNMMKTLTTTNTTFKKSVLSFLVISALAGSSISWENYLPRAESEEIKAAFEQRNASLESIVTQTAPHVDSDALAVIAEDNLTSALDAEIDAQVAQQAEAFIAQSESTVVDGEQLEMQKPDQSNDPLVAAAPLESTLSGDKRLVHEGGEESQQFGSVVDDKAELFMMVSPLLFAFDSSEINPNYYEALNDSARFIQDEATTEDTIWQVVGYADLSGNALYNSKLAKQRAQKVAAYLVDKGVDEAQLSVVSLGASNPLNSERSIENNRHERRVEIHRYQAEITALAEQSQQQMQGLRAERKAQQESALVAKQLETDAASVSEEVVESKVAEMNPNAEETVIEKSSFKRLTTAMEL